MMLYHKHTWAHTNSCAGNCQHHIIPSGRDMWYQINDPRRIRVPTTRHSAATNYENEITRSGVSVSLFHTIFDHHVAYLLVGHMKIDAVLN